MSTIRRLRASVRVAISWAAAIYVSAYWRLQIKTRNKHGLPGRLAVTLTSYPQRFPTLSLTLRSLLAQSIRPDSLYLWIAEADVNLLPAAVRRLQEEGLEIRTCQDLRSYKKIMPALQLNSDQFLVTADDDQYYSRHWLRGLVLAYRPGLREVVCGRAHRIRLDADGMPLPYLSWETDVQAGASERLLFPTGVGGVLYEPNIFHCDVTRTDIYSTICPTADDIWLYWMAALNGARFRKVGPRRREIVWNGSQRNSLFSTNRTANDDQIRNMIARYGFPPL